MRDRNWSESSTGSTFLVVRSRGQHCGDVDLVGYLANAAGPVPLVLDLRIAHDRFGSSSDPTLNGTLHYPNPNDVGKSLNEAGTDKIRKYHTDYNNNPPNAISFMPAMASTLGVIVLSFSPRGVLFDPEVKMWKYSCQGNCFTY